MDHSSLCQLIILESNLKGDLLWKTSLQDGGVVVDRCSGCGRCLPICPLGLISKWYILSGARLVCLDGEDFGCWGARNVHCSWRKLEQFYRHFLTSIARLLGATSYVRPLETVASLLRSEDVDAVELHTGAGYVSFTWSDESL